MTEPWTFGVDALPQTERAATLLRQIAGLLIALEADEAAVDRLLEDLTRARRELAALVPGDPRPRVGAAVDAPGRVYLDHARDIGGYNPCFPEYEMSVAGDRASGTVEFPVAYEGPPGIVHGGFLAVFFDCAIQHHSCDAGTAGRTTRLALRYRRPVPLLTRLAFELERSTAEGRITTTGRLLDGDVVLCEAEMAAVAGDRAALPAVSPRRPPP